MSMVALDLSMVSQYELIGLGYLLVCFALRIKLYETNIGSQRVLGSMIPVISLIIWLGWTSILFAGTVLFHASEHYSVFKKCLRFLLSFIGMLFRKVKTAYTFVFDMLDFFEGCAG